MAASTELCDRIPEADKAYKAKLKPSKQTKATTKLKDRKNSDINTENETNKSSKLTKNLFGQKGQRTKTAIKLKAKKILKTKIQENSGRMFKETKKRSGLA